MYLNTCYVVKGHVPISCWKSKGKWEVNFCWNVLSSLVQPLSFSSFFNFLGSPFWVDLLPTFWHYTDLRLCNQFRVLFKWASWHHHHLCSCPSHVVCQFLDTVLHTLPKNLVLTSPVLIISVYIQNLLHCSPKSTLPFLLGHWLAAPTPSPKEEVQEQDLRSSEKGPLNLSIHKGRQFRGQRKLEVGPIRTLNIWLQANMAKRGISNEPDC